MQQRARKPGARPYGASRVGEETDRHVLEYQLVQGKMNNESESSRGKAERPDTIVQVLESGTDVIYEASAPFGHFTDVDSPPPAMVRNDSPKVTVSWELGLGSCTTALLPAADPLAQTEGDDTAGESLGPSPTSAQPLLTQSSTSPLYALTSTARAQLLGIP
ncbi:hypothetical protein MG293_004996 [Ovis ammon polii]|uniref:Uncharacterized protein n=1 Tax=Ovis ammon polii TaxID=230172 RepID=A0AAD4UJB8_OVIAM|nr:hypothetical protein MG293_004996 [Ovis ammon polii]KAI4574453.1 hypothetical protein MJT46_003732 [Ovis ammon polii x Ovis aries]